MTSVNALTDGKAPVASQDRFSLGVHGARGLFAFAVLVHHVINSGLPSWELPHLAEQSTLSLKYGVELFFAISGFVILGTMQRARSPANFLIDRATRIYPVLWTAVICVSVLYLINGDWPVEVLWHENFLPYLVANLMALPGVIDLPLFLPPAWTLSYEFTFYLLCFVYLLAQRWLRANAAIPLFLIGIALITIYPRGLFFLCGLLVCANLVRGRLALFLSRFPGLLLLVFLIAWQAAAISSGTEDDPTKRLFGSMWSWTAPQMLPLTAIAFAAVTLAIQGIAKGNGWLGGRVLQSRPMLWLGTVSYSLYLWHPIVLGVVKGGMYALGLPELLGDWSKVAFFVLAAPPSLAVAHLSQVLLERRATKILRNLLKGQKSRRERSNAVDRTAAGPRAIGTPTGSGDA